MFVRLVVLSALTFSGLVPAAYAVDVSESLRSAVAVERKPPVKKPKTDFDPHTVLVKFRGSASSAARALGARGASRGRTVDGTGYVEVRSAAAAPDLLRSLQKDKAVESVSLNYIYRATAVPNDELYRRGLQPYLNTVRLPQAWDLRREASSQLIAVLDSGVETSHPDLAGRTVPGYNAITPGASANDDNGHGTWVAGVAAASTNNTQGIAGAAWAGRIQPVKVLDSEGNGTAASVARGIIFAAGHGARVINMSLGGPASPAIHSAVQQAVSRGVVVVASSGNSGANVAEFPAAYPEVLAVGATDHSGGMTDFSTWGDWVDIVAPGFNITSTGRRGIYHTGLIGTSFSAPLVAGVAALVRARFPTFSPAGVMARLKATARDGGPRGVDPYYGHGFLDAYHALGGGWAPELSTLSLGFGDTFEPNNMPAAAKEIKTSAAATTTVSGDVDWYYYVAPEGATTARFVATPPPFEPARPANFDAILSVYDKDLRLLETVDGADPEEPEVSQLTVAPGDKLFIQVRNYNGGPDSRQYQLTVSAGEAATLPPLEQLWVSDVSPQDFAGGVPVDAKPTVTFQRNIDPASASAITLVNGRTLANVPASVTFAGNIATITPAAPLLDNTPYRIRVGAVREPGGAVHNGVVSTTFRTVDLAPPPATTFDASGAGPGMARLAWSVPNISDFDAAVVRRAVGNTPPASPSAGVLAFSGPTTTATVSGLSNDTHSFSVWIRDRSGKYSAAPVVGTTLIGTRFATTVAPTTVTYGGTVRFTGRLTRVDTGAVLANTTVQLYSRVRGSSVWQVLKSVTTSSSGYAVFLFKPSNSRSYRWGYNGTPDLLGATGSTVSVAVRPVITASLSRSTIRLGESALVYGGVLPNHYGQLVYLQRYLSSGWTNAATMRLDSRSTYRFTVRPTTRGLYAYRVVRPADTDHLTAISPTRHLRIT